MQTLKLLFWILNLLNTFSISSYGSRVKYIWNFYLRGHHYLSESEYWRVNYAHFCSIFLPIGECEHCSLSSQATIPTNFFLTKAQIISPLKHKESKELWKQRNILFCPATVMRIYYIYIYNWFLKTKMCFRRRLCHIFFFIFNRQKLWIIVSPVKKINFPFSVQSIKVQEIKKKVKLTIKQQLWLIRCRKFSVQTQFSLQLHLIRFFAF